MYNFLQGTKIIIEVLFPGEFRIGWEYEGVKYVPGSGSYYDLDTALDQAWQAFCREFPHLTKRALDSATYERDGLLFCKTCGSGMGAVEDEPPSQ